MRQITRNACAAFMQGQHFERSNTHVFQEPYTRFWHLELFGNCIAKRTESGRLQISSAGWNTTTTRERLNGLPGVSVYQRRGVLHLNGAPWDGDWIDINESTLNRGDIR